MKEIRHSIRSDRSLSGNLCDVASCPESLRLRRKVARERAARQEAERILEEKSREIYSINKKLENLNEGLERTVLQRTSELRKSILRIERQHRHAELVAKRDSLTGLPNRRFITSFLQESTANWRGSFFLCIDLDRFKQINDTFGHAAGDAVLVEVAHRLKEVAPTDAVIARMGGDEFFIVIPAGKGERVASSLSATVIDRLSEPVNFRGIDLRFSASVGVARGSLDHRSYEDLIIEADLALYSAKESGRGRAIVFSQEMREKCINKKRLSDDLLQALARGEIRPFYQPRICVNTGKIACVEALARWHHPNNGIIEPIHFMTIADDMGRLADIDDVILRQAVSDLCQWDRSGFHIPRVSVNVSKERLMQPNLLEVLDNLSISLERISFELLESIFFDSAENEVLKRIDDIRSRGIKIEIDDFGSGHASINGLIFVRPDTLKIDRHLVASACGDPELFAILKSVVSIGDTLNIEIVAEGVEATNQIEMCSAVGCNQLQGFAISRPISAKDLLYFRDKSIFK